jgi:hypothetical protein
MSDPHDAIKCGGSKGFAVPPGGAIALELAPELSASVQIEAPRVSRRLRHWRMEP